MSKIMNVPENLITGKDLDYLSDMFEWNYIAFKKTCADINMIDDQELVRVFGEVCDLFEDNLNQILCLLKNPGGDTCE